MTRGLWKKASVEYALYPSGLRIRLFISWTFSPDNARLLDLDTTYGFSWSRKKTMEEYEIKEYPTL